jgi:ribonuclease HI
MKNEISIYCDGGARGNPGPAAIGFVVFQNERIVHKFSKRIGKTTNNVAEYRAVIEALTWLNENPKIIHYPLSILHFYLDSQLIVNQLKGHFKVKNSNLQKLIVWAKSAERKIKREINYTYIPRRQNKVADALVNQALNGL